MKLQQSVCLAIAAASLLLRPEPSAAGSAVTTASLLDEMTNLAGMAEFPNPSYTCKQFSSYDQKSKTPGNEDWFANGDAGQFLRVEDQHGRKEFVMMDAAGPGAIVRIWSANPAGVLRIYLDGAEKPVFESPMGDLLGGKYPGLPRPIAGEYSRGWNLYFPIPYAKSCKVTSDKPKFYYHVNYRTYAAGTTVETFQGDELKSLAQPIERLGACLATPASYHAAEGVKSTELEVKLAPGKTFSKKLRGSQAISELRMQVSAPDVVSALRSVKLKITFDGEPTVETPVGDFFGSGPGLENFSTLPVGMERSGAMYSHWFMPFAKSAVIELTNMGRQEVAISGALSVAKYRWTDRSMHFHAKWRTQFGIPTRPFIDWNYLSASGRGVFAGVSFAIDNPVTEWWGEGDEKIYVDGETFPSHFGTGTEDYYGYAWCWPEPFTHAYHAQPRCDGPGNYGRTSVCRFHIIDRIPFQSSFKFDMELWHWHPNTNVNMAVLPYWYAKPGGTDTIKPIEVADTLIQPMPRYRVHKVKGALEGEELKIVRRAGDVGPQPWQGVSNGKHLWWSHGMRVGDTLAVSFESRRAGKFRVFGRFLSARDYGIHQLAINGQNAGEPIDFYSPDVVPMDEKDLGVYELKQGENEFSAKVIGTSPKGVKGHMFGLDYLRLKPIK